MAIEDPTVVITVTYEKETGLPTSIHTTLNTATSAYAALAALTALNKVNGMPKEMVMEAIDGYWDSKSQLTQITWH